jgi:hypothetical protein
MGTDGYKTKIHNLFIENELINDEIEKQIKKSIHPSCKSVPENFARYKTKSREIKKVDKFNYQIPDIS